MPVHDWHPNAYCGVSLYGEVEGGVERKQSSSASRSRSRTPFSQSPTSIPSTPKAESRSSSPAPGPSSHRAQSSMGSTRARQASMDQLAESGRAQGIDSVMNRLEEISITRQVLPQVPAYPDGNGSREEVEALPWLNGLHRADKPFEVLYNPNPTGGLTDLTMSVIGEQNGLGGYRLELLSQIVSIRHSFIIFEADNLVHYLCCYTSQTYTSYTSSHYHNIRIPTRPRPNRFVVLTSRHPRYRTYSHYT